MKRSLCLLLFFALSLSGMAQKSEGTFHFGLKAAPSLAWLKADQGLTGNGSKLGFTYGLITEFNFAERYAFATGLDVSYRGGKTKSITTVNLKNGAGGDSTITTTTESTTTLQYIEIPITLKLKTNEIGYLTYYLQAGLAPGINIRARGSSKTSTQISSGGSSVNNSAEADDTDVKSGVNSLNLSMVIGGGVEYTLSGSTVLLAGIEFNNGFVDVFDGPTKANSNFLALKLGVLF